MIISFIAKRAKSLKPYAKMYYLQSFMFKVMNSHQHKIKQKWLMVNVADRGIEAVPVVAPIKKYFSVFSVLTI